MVDSVGVLQKALQTTELSIGDLPSEGYNDMIAALEVSVYSLRYFIICCISLKINITIYYTYASINKFMFDTLN